MSYSTLAQQVLDEALYSRVNAAAQQEARENPNVADSELAARIRAASNNGADYFIWDVSLATEAEYASALAAENPDPGGDEAVITDNMILSAIQANWPTDST